MSKLSSSYKIICSRQVRGKTSGGLNNSNTREEIISPLKGQGK